MDGNKLFKLILNCILLNLLLFNNSYAIEFINSLDIKIANLQPNDLDNIRQEYKILKSKKGTINYLYNNKILANDVVKLASISSNIFGAISQDIKFNIYNHNNSKIGSCNIHIGVGSYAARPDFTGSGCNLINNEYIQINPKYTIRNNTYKIVYTLSNHKTFSRIILFGDSLSDKGNLHNKSKVLNSLTLGLVPVIPAVPPYFEGRFSNYKVWAEYLREKLNIPVSSIFNYAYAGASVERDRYPVPNLDDQVDTYMTFNLSGDPYALYIVWIGSNDFLRHIQDKSDQELIDSILFGVEKNLVKLINNGAKNILSPQLPDITAAPDSLEKDQKNGDTKYTERLNKLLLEYNKQHRDMLAKLKKQYPDVSIMTFDVYQFFRDSLKYAKELGFTNITDKCNPNTYWEDHLTICDTPPEYVFWDSVHPTGRIHELLGEQMYNLILKHGYKPNNDICIMPGFDDIFKSPNSDSSNYSNYSETNCIVNSDIKLDNFSLDNERAIDALTNKEYNEKQYISFAQMIRSNIALL